MPPAEVHHLEALNLITGSPNFGRPVLRVINARRPPSHNASVRSSLKTRRWRGGSKILNSGGL